MGIDICIPFGIQYKKGFLVSKMQTTIRLDEDDYKQAHEVVKYIGMNYAQAVNMFNGMVVLERGLPFEIKIPNKKTLKAMNEAIDLDGNFISLDDIKREYAAICN